jgi:hypothetical protein
MVMEGRPMTAATAGRTTGIWLDVPSKSGRHEIVRLSLERMAYATLYQIGLNGGLDWSECVAISGPEAE